MYWMESGMSYHANSSMEKSQNLERLGLEWMDFFEYLLPLLLPSHTSKPARPVSRGRRTQRRRRAGSPASTSANGIARSASVRHTHTSLFISSPWCRYTTGLPVLPVRCPFFAGMRCSPSRYPSLVMTTCSSCLYPCTAHSASKSGAFRIFSAIVASRDLALAPPGFGRPAKWWKSSRERL